MHKFAENKNYVTFSLTFLRIPPSSKMLFQALMLQNICLLDRGLGMRQGERELWDILKICAKYCHTDVNVARNKNKVKEYDR
jgi:hypothetical protein